MDVGADDAVGAEHADLEIGDVHRAALAVAGAAVAAEQLAHHGGASAPLAMVWPWPRWVDSSTSLRRRVAAHADRDRLLADRGMDRAQHQALLLRRQTGFLEGADARHLMVQTEHTLGIEIAMHLSPPCQPVDGDAPRCR